MATFIFVHGTWAKSARWPILQDGLAEATRAAGDEPVFERLTWTGRNWARDRQAAASAILTLVQRIQRGAANEKIFIIGHSHGGSAIAYFLKKYPEAARTLGGCAFLSTPFVAIRARKRPLLVLTLLIFFPYVAFLTLLNNKMSADLYSLLVSGVVGALLWRALAIIKSACAPQNVEQTIRQQTADIPTGNYLFLRCSGDEAAAALSAAQILAWATVKISKILELITRPLLNPNQGQSELRRVVPWVVVSSVLLPSFSYAWFKVRPGICKSGVEHLFPDGLFRQNDLTVTLVYTAVGLFGLVSLVAICLLLLCVLAALFIVLIQAATSWAFGWTRLATGFLVELAIEPLPFGEHSLVHIDWTGELDGKVHSWTYAHPVAIMHLQNWVRVRLENWPMTTAESTPKRP